jgi:hypothetical protein
MDISVYFARHLTLSLSLLYILKKKKNNVFWGKCFRSGFFTPVEGRRERWTGNPPDWGQGVDSSGPLHGYTTGLHWTFVGWKEGLRCVFLTVPVRLWVLGGNPLHKSNTVGFTDGDCPWNLSLGQHTGDGNLMGRHFWVGCGFFSWGDGGGQEETQGQRLLSRFRSMTRTSEQSFLCYILYIDQWRFHYNILRPS